MLWTKRATSASWVINDFVLDKDPERTYTKEKLTGTEACKMTNMVLVSVKIKVLRMFLHAQNPG